MDEGTTTIHAEDGRKDSAKRLIAKFRELGHGPPFCVTYSGAGIKEPFRFEQERAAIVDRLDLDIAADLLTILLDYLPRPLAPAR